MDQFLTSDGIEVAPALRDHLLDVRDAHRVAPDDSTTGRHLAMLCAMESSASVEEGNEPVRRSWTRRTGMVIIGTSMLAVSGMGAASAGILPPVVGDGVQAVLRPFGLSTTIGSPGQSVEAPGLDGSPGQSVEAPGLDGSPGKSVEAPGLDGSPGKSVEAPGLDLAPRGPVDPTAPSSIAVVPPSPEIARPPATTSSKKINPQVNSTPEPADRMGSGGGNRGAP